MVLIRILAAMGMLVGLSSCLMIPEDKLYQALNERDKSERQVYKLYPGDVKPTSDLSVVEIGDIPFVKIDGMSVKATDYQVIHLLPGRHIFVCQKEFGFSVMVESSGIVEFETTLAVVLQADHTYKLFFERSTGPGYKLYFWVVDTADGKVIGGNKKP